MPSQYRHAQLIGDALESQVWWHLGPGLANGVANLHNAQKARSGIVNVVGDHALGHARQPGLSPRTRNSRKG